MFHAAHPACNIASLSLGGDYNCLERDGYNLNHFNNMHLKPRPDPGLAVLKCAEFTRERSEHSGGYRGTSLIRTPPPYDPMPRDLW